MKPKSRPDYTGVQRLEIIQIMRLRGWTVAQVATRFVLHPNTVRAWLRALENEGDAAKLFTAPVWNRLHDAIRWTTQEIRRICPEPEVGTRTIAAMIVRKGIQISRSSVQRILRGTTPTAPKPPMLPPTDSLGDLTSPFVSQAQTDLLPPPSLG
jgi:transposase